MFLLTRRHQQVRHRHEQRDPAAERFQKLATIKVEVVERSREEFVAFQFQRKFRIEFFFHLRTSFAVPEAISIALTIRR